MLLANGQPAVGVTFCASEGVECCTLEVGDYDDRVAGGLHRSPCPGNDAVNYISIPEGLSVCVSQDDVCGSGSSRNKWTFHGPGVFTAPDDFSSNTLSSASVFLTSSFHLPIGVTFCDSEGVECCTLEEGDYEDNVNGGLFYLPCPGNDAVKNISIPEGFSVCVSQHDLCGSGNSGATWTFHGPGIFTAPDDFSSNTLTSASVYLTPHFADGWYYGNSDESCDDACERYGLGCTEEELFNHNHEVDSSEKMVALIARLGGPNAPSSCGNDFGTNLDVPQWKPDRCHHSSPNRALSAFSCAQQPLPQGQSKRRLCFCHGSPTSAPTTPTDVPTSSPTSIPTLVPTGNPTSSPTRSPTGSPTVAPTFLPTSEPTTVELTVVPSMEPTVATLEPTAEPTVVPSMKPTTVEPTTAPSVDPTVQPSREPSKLPTSSSTPETTISIVPLSTQSPTVATSHPSSAPITDNDISVAYVVETETVHAYDPVVYLLVLVLVCFMACCMGCGIGSLLGGYCCSSPQKAGVIINSVEQKQVEDVKRHPRSPMTEELWDHGTTPLAWASGTTPSVAPAEPTVEDFSSREGGAAIPEDEDIALGLYLPNPTFGMVAGETEGCQQTTSARARMHRAYELA